MVNFEWYRSFIAVYRSGTVTGAAQARNLTQPAISQHLVALETMMKQSLFQRTPRKMIPTAYGKELYSRMAPSMDSLEKVSMTLRDTPIKEVPTIRLGVPLDYFHIVGIEKLKKSQLQLHIEIGDAEKMIESLSRGKLDAVIATQQIRGNNLDYLKIGTEEFCLVASPEIQLPRNLTSKKSPPNEIEQFLLEQNWISYSADLPIIRRFWHVAFNQRPDIKPLMVVPSLLAIRKAVETGWGVSVLPLYICEQPLREGKLSILWKPKKAILNDLWIVTRKVDRNKPHIISLISHLNSKA
jgi:DNA-binding transcriptional LysR family regulator